MLVHGECNVERRERPSGGVCKKTEEKWDLRQAEGLGRNTEGGRGKAHPPSFVVEELV
jgi:hypothetical protein